MSTLFALFMLMLLALFWRAAARAREQVILACRRACRELGLQFLDETVVLRGIRVRRGPSGRLTLARRYTFEFSASGQERCDGWALAIGHSVERITLDHPEGRLIVAGKAGVSYGLLDRLERPPGDREQTG
jgi:hypothetical protein